MQTDLVGMIYEDAMVFGLSNISDRQRWFNIISDHGLEEADAFLFSKKFEKVDLVGTEDPLPWSQWIVASKVNSNYILVPWVADPECPLLEKECMKPHKILYGTRGFSGLDRHMMYVLFVYKIEIPIQEIEKYNIYLTAMKFLIGNPDEIFADI